jgi:hypothetical protein
MHKYEKNMHKYAIICSTTFIKKDKFHRINLFIQNLLIQGGNFNWNKIHNLEIVNFCKKSRNRSIFIFPCPNFDAYGFCISAPGSVQPPPTFFFNGRVCQVTPRLKDHFARNTTHYLFPRYFQSLRAKN